MYRKFHCTLFYVVFVSTIFFIIISLIAFMKGYRFSSDAAIHTVQFAQTDDYKIILDEQISSNLVFNLIDTGNYYHTVYCKRYSFFWKSFVGTSDFKKTDDDVALLNKYWLKDPGVGWIVSVSHDPKVNSFLVSYGNQTIRQEAILNQPIAIVIKSSDIKNLDVGFHAVALSKDDEILYNLEYLVENNIVHANEYRWFPVYTNG